jgi:predicted nuclease of predicted toxin-antitoxin system
MKVKLDENMPTAMAELLRGAGHDSATVAEEGLSGTDDKQILRTATAEDRIVITFDVGFGNIRAFPPGSHAGVVVFRLHDQRWAVLEEPARRMLNSGTLDRLRRGLAIINESRVRIGKRQREKL